MITNNKKNHIYVITSSEKKTKMKQEQDKVPLID